MHFFFQIEELIYLSQNEVLHNLHNVIVEREERGVERRRRGGFNKHCPVVFLTWEGKGLEEYLISPKGLH